MTTKKQEESPPAEDAAQSPIIAQLMRQIADLQKQVSRGTAPEEYDQSQSPFERARRAEHARIKASQQRDPERDADPNLVWTGGRYQVRPIPRGFVPVQTVPGQIKLPEQPKGAEPGRTALPISVPGDVLQAGG